MNTVAKKSTKVGNKTVAQETSETQSGPAINADTENRSKRGPKAGSKRFVELNLSQLEKLIGINKTVAIPVQKNWITKFAQIMGNTIEQSELPATETPKAESVSFEITA
jgi:hypothetical protein